MNAMVFMTSGAQNLKQGRKEKELEITKVFVT